MLRAIGQLKKKDDIVITKPDKGSGVVVMGKSDYVRLLGESSISNETKFRPYALKDPKWEEDLPSISTRCCKKKRS